MPLVTCPDCARRVSAAAPACVHCGRPMRASSSSLNPEKPTWGIAAALVLGALTLADVLDWEPAGPAALRRVSTVANGAHVLGNAALILCALLSLGGERRAHAVVRGLSLGMMIVICAAMLASWRLGALATSGARDEAGPFALVVLGATAFQVAPWALYLYLFRRSRYP